MSYLTGLEAFVSEYRLFGRSPGYTRAAAAHDPSPSLHEQRFPSLAPAFTSTCAPRHRLDVYSDLDCS
jgi:hypothetical protein